MGLVFGTGIGVGFGELMTRENWEPELLVYVSSCLRVGNTECKNLHTWILASLLPVEMLTMGASSNTNEKNVPGYHMS